MRWLAAECFAGGKPRYQVCLIHNA
ncbi:MAG: hypothetical protein ACI9MU_003430 [Alphaproteobacteria bacterium]